MKENFDVVNLSTSFDASSDVPCRILENQLVHWSGAKIVSNEYINVIYIEVICTQYVW